MPFIRHDVFVVVDSICGKRPRRNTGVHHKIERREARPRFIALLINDDPHINAALFCVDQRTHDIRRREAVGCQTDAVLRGIDDPEDKILAASVR